MNPSQILLFVYGTLRPDAAPPEIAEAASRLELVSPATVPGRLLQLTEYPGLILDDASDAPRVPGTIFAVPDGRTLAALDEYEGFRVSNPETSLFQRTHATATLPDGSKRPCWVYVYNGGAAGTSTVQ